MESRNYNYNSVESILLDIKKWYIKNGVAVVNSMRFDIPNKMSQTKVRTVMAFDRVLRTEMACDIKIEESFLEKIKICLNGMH